MNAKKEFLEETKNKDIKSAMIYIKDYDSDEYYEIDYDENYKGLIKLPSTIFLKENYNVKEYNDFLKKIDKEYDSGFGAQELFGVILYTDGTWSERYEYDGSEGWSFKSCPIIDYGADKL